jgi:MFS superfamily sulfate permease-like transporter
VVIAASLSLADVSGTVRLWRQRRVEFLLTITGFLGVALLGVLEGIAVAVALSILKRLPASLAALPNHTGTSPRDARAT